MVKGMYMTLDQQVVRKETVLFVHDKRNTGLPAVTGVREGN